MRCLGQGKLKLNRARGCVWVMDRVEEWMGWEEVAMMA